MVHLSAAQQVPGYGITWYGACTGTGACDVTMNSDLWLDAEFQPVPTIVPNVVGLTLAAAGQALTKAGFFQGTVNEQASSTVPAGQLISQSPAAGTSLLGGSNIDVTLSTGAPKNSGGGGGAMDWLTLGTLLGALVAVRWSRCGPFRAPSGASLGRPHIAPRVPETRAPPADGAAFSLGLTDS